MILSFHPCFDGDIQIILGDRSLDSAILKRISEADAIILPQACPQNLYEVCVGSGAHVFPNYNVRVRYPGKIGQARMFRDHGLPHPKTFAWESVAQFNQACPDSKHILPHKFPFLIKEDGRHEAEGIFFIEDRAGLRLALDGLALRETSGPRGFVTQDYVSCGGNVLRAVIVGARVLTYWKRASQPGQRITTISRGALIDPDWRPELQEEGKIQARALAEKTGINLAAVDVVFSAAEKEPEPFFLEINYYFGRRGLGGTEGYYALLYEAVREWLTGAGIDPRSVRPV